MIHTTSRARVRAAMELGVSDRVPVFCQLAIGHYFLHSGFAPFDVWFRSEALAEALVKLQRRYRFDGILVNLPGRDPEFERYIDRIERRDEDRETLVHWKNGNYTRVPDDDNPHYFLGSGDRYFPRFDEVDPDALWYVEPWDLTDVTYPYTWGFDAEPRPFETFFPDYHADTIRHVRQAVGETASVHSEVFSPFSQLLELLNYEHALVGLLDDPGKCHAMLERLTLGAIDLGTRQARAGVDAVLVSSAFAGAGLISRDDYETFVLPYEKLVIDGIHAEHPDVKVYTHTCGAIADRLDLMLATGTQGVDTLDPPPLGTVELPDAVRELAGKAFIKGNIDPVHTLLYGDEQTVRDAVVYRMEHAKPGGGYILSSACSVAPAVEPHMIETLVEIAHELGVYEGEETIRASDAPTERAVVASSADPRAAEPAASAAPAARADWAMLNERLYAGDAAAVAELTEAALQQGRAAEEVLQEGLIAGMAVVGEDFKHNRIYVPQVLVAARAMKAGMAVLRPILTGEAGGRMSAYERRTIVLGTVKGDLHDIGKNLVGMMSEGAGYEVVDLGVDVKLETFVSALREHDAGLLGMSALLTTTMPYMKVVIDGLAAHGLGDVKVCIGGAPVSAGFAIEVGAAGYAPDAASAVDLFQQLYPVTAAK